MSSISLTACYVPCPHIAHPSMWYLHTTHLSTSTLRNEPLKFLNIYLHTYIAQINYCITLHQSRSMPCITHGSTLRDCLLSSLPEHLVARLFLNCLSNPGPSVLFLLWAKTNTSIIYYTKQFRTHTHTIRLAYITYQCTEVAAHWLYTLVYRKIDIRKLLQWNLSKMVTVIGSHLWGGCFRQVSW